MSDTKNVRIGLQGARELELEVADAEAAKKAVETAVSNGEAIVWLTDNRGYSFGVVADKLAFIEIEGEAAGTGIGF